MGFIVSVSWSLYGYLLGDLFIQARSILASSLHGSKTRTPPPSLGASLISFAPPGAKRHRGAAQHPAAATICQVRVERSDVACSRDAVSDWQPLLIHLILFCLLPLASTPGTQLRAALAMYTMLPRDLFDWCRRAPDLVTATLGWVQFLVTSKPGLNEPSGHATDTDSS
jgi:hypothetical protein